MDLHRDEVECNCVVDKVQYRCTVSAFVQHDRKFFSPVTPSGDRYFIVDVTGINMAWQVPNPMTLTSYTTEHILLDIAESSIEEDMSPILLHFDIPEEVRRAMIATISEAAKNKSSTADRIYRTLCMNVVVRIATSSWTEEGNYDHDDDDDKEGGEASMEDQHQRSAPASRSSVVSIRRAEEEEGSSDCTICLEKCEVGGEAIRMPCSHSFHSSCILEWLNHRNICPLCRFQLSPCGR